MSKRILIAPLLIFLTFVVIVVLFFMLVLGAMSGDDDTSADDRPAQEQPAATPPADEPEADEDDDKEAEETKTTATAPKQQEDPIAAADLKVGICISDARSTLGDVTTFDEAECNEPHDGEVYTLIKLPGAEGTKYPGTKFVTGKGQRGCRARLRRQATTAAFRDRQLGYKFVYPTRLSWADGDREITCLATFKKPRSETLAQR